MGDHHSRGEYLWALWGIILQGDQFPAFPLDSGISLAHVPRSSCLVESLGNLLWIWLLSAALPETQDNCPPYDSSRGPDHCCSPGSIASGGWTQPASKIPGIGQHIWEEECEGPPPTLGLWLPYRPTTGDKDPSRTHLRHVRVQTCCPQKVSEGKPDPGIHEKAHFTRWSPWPIHPEGWEPPFQTAHLWVNYWALNQVTIHNQYPLPLIPELLVQLKPACIFTKLNLSGAYNWLRVRAGDECKMTCLLDLAQAFWVFSYAFWTLHIPALYQGCIVGPSRSILIAYLDDL